MAVKPEDLREIAGEVIELLGIDNFTNVKITGAFKAGSVWKVNFTFSPGMALYQRNGCFSVGIQSEDIIGMWLDRSWK